MTNRKNLKFKTKTKGGFTLIETLIAVLLLMMAIAGPLTLASKGLQVTLIAKDEDTAFYLAQDAVEYMRWVRDTNKLRGNTWLAGLDGTPNGHTTGGGTCASSNGCYVDSLKDTAAICSSVPCPTLLYDSTNNYFGYTSGTASIFTRTVILSVIGSEAALTVTVSWRDQGNIQRTATVREEIFDWE